MLSIRHDGLSISEVVGIYLGDNIKHIMRLFTVVLLIFGRPGKDYQWHDREYVEPLGLGQYYFDLLHTFHLASH